MKTTIEYLDEAKNKLKLDSDYSMAKFLGVGRSAISGYRTASRIIDDYAAAKIANALGINPMIVIAAANAEREKTEERKDYWRNFYERLGGVAASILLLTSCSLVTLIVTSTPADAANTGIKTFEFNNLYIIRNWKAWKIGESLKP